MSLPSVIRHVKRSFQPMHHHTGWKKSWDKSNQMEICDQSPTPPEVLPRLNRDSTDRERGIGNSVGLRAIPKLHYWLALSHRNGSQATCTSAVIEKSGSDAHQSSTLLFVLMRFEYSINQVPEKNLNTADTLFRSPVSQLSAGDEQFQQEVKAFLDLIVKNVPATEKQLHDIQSE